MTKFQFSVTAVLWFPAAAQICVRTRALPLTDGKNQSWANARREKLGTVFSIDLFQHLSLSLDFEPIKPTGVVSSSLQCF